MNDNNFSQDQLSLPLGLPLPEEIKVSPKIKRIVELVFRAEESDEFSFMHSVLCQLGMPRKYTEGRVFERENGKGSLIIEAGKLWDGEKIVEKPLPYGPKPRLIMIHLSTEAIRTQSPVVEVGKSLRDFLKILGVDPNGRNYHMFKKQMEALAACRLILGMTKDNKAVTINTNPITKFEAWIAPDSSMIWPGVMQLSEDFYSTLLTHAVPIPNHALVALKDSALALDIYTWLAHRLYRIRKQEGIFIPWLQLKEQFGHEYRCMKDFVKKFRISLRYVKIIYQDANIDEEKEGLRLYASAPPVRKIQAQILPFKKN